MPPMGLGHGSIDRSPGTRGQVGRSAEGGVAPQPEGVQPAPLGIGTGLDLRVVDDVGDGDRDQPGRNRDEARVEAVLRPT
jgi:hypothetical protein